MSFRSAPGRNASRRDTRIEAGFSNFLFIDREFRSHPVLRRILSLVRKHDYHALTLEEIREGDCALLQRENEALARRCPDFEGSQVHRLGFWKCDPERAADPDDFIGYAIFKSDRFRNAPHPSDHIYEAVVPPTRAKSENNFLHCRRTYGVETVAGTRNTTGVLYAQQNDRTFVCAHVALRTALGCLLPDGDVDYGEMNRLAGVDHTTRRVGDGTSGLSPDEMEAVLDGFGVEHTKIVHEPDQGHHLPTEFQRELYGFIESGGQALLGFELQERNPGPDGSRRHIVPVIGHTFNDDAWVPDAQRAYFGDELGYFPSESWLSSYVLHDDNFGPYYCMPRHYLSNDNCRLILGMQPVATEYSAVDAEVVGFDYLHAIARSSSPIGQSWYDRFLVYARHGLLVLRTFLVERSEYVRHLREIRSWEGDSLESPAIERLESTLPERFWMIEASAPELFASSRRKFGEILLASDRVLPRPVDLSLLLAARIPGEIMIFQNDSLDAMSTNLRGHTGLFEHRTES